MSIPEKYKQIVENAEQAGTIPEHVWLSYSVCVMDDLACGWTGWIIESVWKLDNAADGAALKTRANEIPVTSANNQICPNCGKVLFRTSLERKYLLGPAGEAKILYDYEVLPPVYE